MPNIDEIIAAVNGSKFNGLASPNRFLVQLFPPVFMQNDSYPTTGELEFFCDTTNLPGKFLNTIDYKPQGFGDTTRMPTSRTQESLQTTFFCDSNYSVLSFFQTWLNFIVQSDSEFTPSQISDGGRGYREIGFQEDYARTIFIKGFSNNGNVTETIQYTLYNAYPIQLGSVQTGWEINDSILKLPVEFTYSHYDVVRQEVGTSGVTAGSVGLFTRLAQLGSYGAILSTLRRPRSVQDVINIITRSSTILKTLHL